MAQRSNRSAARILAAGMCFGLLAAPTQAETQRDGRSRIIGGEPARLADWPGLGALRRTSLDGARIEYVCGVTAITPDWALTAAHCVTEFARAPVADALAGMDGARRATRLEAAFGVDDLGSVASADVYPVAAVSIHPAYQKALDAAPTVQARAGVMVRAGADIALLRLARPWDGPLMPLSQRPGADPADGEAVVAAGFGKTERGVFRAEAALRSAARERPAVFAPAQTLAQARFPVLSQSACREGYADLPGARISPSELCAGLPEGDRSPCSGDSGGPLARWTAAGPRQIGVVSWGPVSCGAPGRAVVYTRVSAYADWIADVLGARPPPPPAAAARPDALLRAFARQLGASAEAGRAHRAELSLLGGPRLTVGARTAVSLRSDVAGRVVLLDIDADDRITLLSPAPGASTATALTITPGRSLRLPANGELEATPPLGSGALVALIAPSNANIGALQAVDGALARRLDGGAPARLLMRLARAVEGRSETAEWGVATLPYEIIAPR